MTRQSPFTVRKDSKSMLISGHCVIHSFRLLWTHPQNATRPHTEVIAERELLKSLTVSLWVQMHWMRAYRAFSEKACYENSPSQLYTSQKILQKPNTWTGVSPCIKGSSKVKSLLQSISLLCPSFVTCFRSEGDHNLQSRGETSP